MNYEIPKYQKIKASKKKVIFMFLIGWVFVIIGLSLIKSTEGFESFIGWICLIFLGTGGVIITAIQIFIPTCSYLELDCKGFTICYLFRKHSYNWDDINEFYVSVIHGNKMVSFDFSEKYDKSKVGRKAAKFISGVESSLPDTFEIKPEELAELMFMYKARYFEDK